MRQISAQEGRIKITMQALMLGDDLFVAVSGGDGPHIGAVTMSIPRASMSGPGRSASTSVMTMPGHKDDEAARMISHILSSKLYKNVVVVCGIHVDGITAAEINTVMNMLGKLTERLIRKQLQTL
jgi:hypothetical protein